MSKLELRLQYDGQSTERKKQVLIFSPVLVAACANVLHRREAARDAGKAVEVVHDGAACLQVIRVSCGLRGWG